MENFLETPSGSSQPNPIFKSQILVATRSCTKLCSVARQPCIASYKKVSANGQLCAICSRAESSILVKFLRLPRLTIPLEFNTIYIIYKIGRKILQIPCVTFWPKNAKLNRANFFLEKLQAQLAENHHYCHYQTKKCFLGTEYILRRNWSGKHGIIDRPSRGIGGQTPADP